MALGEHGKCCAKSSNGSIEFEGVVEVPHYQEKLSFVQNPVSGTGGGEVQTGASSLRKRATESVTSDVMADPTESSLRRASGNNRAVVRVRSRTPGTGEDDAVSMIGLSRLAALQTRRCDEDASTGGRGSLPRGCGGSSRTALSPGPVCHWGARFAARHRVRNMKVDVDPTESSPQGHGTVDLSTMSAGLVQKVAEQPSLRCDDLACGSLKKGVESVARVGRKVTVCEEFPARCPRNVMHACLAIELRSLCQKLENSRVGFEIDISQETDPLPDAVPEEWQYLRFCDPSSAEEGVSYSLERVGWEMSRVGEETFEILATEHYARCRLLEFSI